jgi:hypothetical protein
MSGAAVADDHRLDPRGIGAVRSIVPRFRVFSMASATSSNGSGGRLQIRQLPGDLGR